MEGVLNILLPTQRTRSVWLLVDDKEEVEEEEKEEVEEEDEEEVEEEEDEPRRKVCR